MAKKIISLVVALTMVFSMAVCSTSASAIFDWDFDIDLGKALDPLGIADTAKGMVQNLIAGAADKDDASDDAVVEDEETTKFKPLFDFYIDYDVVKTLNYGFEFGNVPETTTEEIKDTVVDETPAVDTTTTTAPATTVELITDPVDITDETPLADVEQIANTGDAGVATIVALSAVSAAAFVVAKKK